MYQQKNAIAASSDSYDKLQHRQLQQYQLQQQHNNLHTIALTKAISENSNEDIAGGVQDTIYLCNFRVSVDGEWLCLKQLQDIDENKQSSITTTLLNVEDTGRVNVGVASNKPRWTFDKRNKCFSGVSPHGNDDNGIFTNTSFYLYGKYIRRRLTYAYYDTNTIVLSLIIPA